MCHCGSPYCEISHNDEAFSWAEGEHQRLMDDPTWIDRYPQIHIRDMAVAQEVWRLIQARYPDSGYFPDAEASRIRERMIQSQEVKTGG